MKCKFSSSHYEVIRYYLEYSQQGTRDGVEIGCWGSVIKIEVTTKQLHSKESKDEDEEKEEKEKRQNRGYGVH